MCESRGAVATAGKGLKSTHSCANASGAGLHHALAKMDVEWGSHHGVEARSRVAVALK